MKSGLLCKSILLGFFGLLISVSTGSFAAETRAASVQNTGSDILNSGALSQGLLLVAFAAIFYFFILRPQSKRAKEHQQLVTNLQKGDEVITTGGILGKITRVTDHFFMIMIAEGVEVPIQRQAVSTSVPKGTLKSI